MNIRIKIQLNFWTGVCSRQDLYRLVIGNKLCHPKGFRKWIKLIKLPWNLNRILQQEEMLERNLLLYLGLKAANIIQSLFLKPEIGRQYNQTFYRTTKIPKISLQQIFRVIFHKKRSRLAVQKLPNQNGQQMNAK